MPSSGPLPLVLGSGSPFRRQILDAAGLTFQVVRPDLDEAVLKREFAANVPALEPGGLADALARAKAEAVSSAHPEAMVIGADQVLALEGELFDKPSDVGAARLQLQRLRGKTHRLYSAAVLATGGQVVWGYVDEAVMTMRAFTPEFLENYIARRGADLCRMVGAYEIEGPGIQLFERVDGDHFTIIGLPLLPLLAELRARGVIEA